jgi:hypothetical protein
LIRRRLTRGADGSSEYHFYYMDVDRPRRLTHLQTNTDLLLTFYYTDDNDMFAIHTASTRYYVVCVEQRTPRYIFANDGTLVAEYVREPFGALVGTGATDDDDGSITHLIAHLPIGVDGNIQDDRVGVYFTHDGTPVDARSGRALAVTLARLMAVVDDADPFTPETMVDYYSKESSEAAGFNMNILDWLRLCGLDVGSMIPLLQLGDAVHKSLCDARSPVVSGSECTHVAQFRRYYTLEYLRTPPTPPAVQPAAHRRMPFVNVNSLWAASTGLLYTSNGKLVRLVESADNQRYHRLLTSALVASTQRVNVTEWPAQDAPELITRQDVCRAVGMHINDDLSALGGIVNTLTPNINVTYDGNDRLLIQSASSLLVVHYGSCAKIEAQRTSRIEQTMIARLWARERRALDTTPSTAVDTRWNPMQVNELRRTGSVSGYEATLQPIAVNRTYLLDDSSFWQLTDTTRRHRAR